jgi:predicted nucleic acid-binding protein
LISSHELTKNIKTKPCTSTSVLTHLNSALSYNKFKSLFSSEDREKIKKCCQHF